MSRIIACYFAEHNGHSGCGNLVWLSDLANDITSVLFFVLFVIVGVWLIYDEFWKKKSE